MAAIVTMAVASCLCLYPPVLFIPTVHSRKRLSAHRALSFIDTHHPWGWCVLASQSCFPNNNINILEDHLVFFFLFFVCLFKGVGVYSSLGHQCQWPWGFNVTELEIYTDRYEIPPPAHLSFSCNNRDKGEFRLT